MCKDGVVTKVGKKSGKDKNQCWIEDDHNENSYDFVTGNPRKLSSTAIKDKEDIGILHPKSWSTIPELEEQHVSALEMDV